MSEQKPTIGRVVHFAYGDTPCAALVTKVIDDATVNCTVFVPPEHQEKAGISFSTQASFDSDGTPATWRWPPRV